MNMKLEMKKNAVEPFVQPTPGFSDIYRSVSDLSCQLCHAINQTREKEKDCEKRWKSDSWRRIDSVLTSFLFPFIRSLLFRLFHLSLSHRIHFDVYLSLIMGNLFSRAKQPVIVTEDEQFFDCLNDDDSHEHDEETTLNETKTISHYYAVWIPPTVETSGK